MINIRTWHRLCISAYGIFPAVIIGWVLPKDSIFIWPIVAVIIWGIIVAALGAIQGIMLACGRLYMGCPRCNIKSNVIGGNSDGIYLACPNCGELRVKLGSLFGLKTIKTGSTEDDLSEYRPESSSPLLAPIRHFIPFAIIFLPVVASITTASIVYKFSFLYLIIPGVWCYCVGGFILDGIFSGHMSDNHGTALRTKAPFRFWSKIGVWSIFYILAAAFPIGFALQERAKAATNSEQVGGGNAHELPSHPSTALPKARATP